MHVSLFLAYMLNDERMKGRGLYRTMYFIPVVTTASVVGIIMIFIEIGYMISESGIVIRIETSSVRICNRPSKGVTLMRIGEDDKVVTIATTPHENEEEDEKADNDDSAENIETTETVEET